MARKQTKVHWAEVFWNFVEANPKLAVTIAFRLGSMAGEAVGESSVTARSLGKKLKAAPEQAADAMQSLSATALKYLPGPSPRLQPRRRPAAKASRRNKNKTKD